MINVIDILDGHIKEMFNINDQLVKERMAICMSCPLYLKSPIGPICNAKLWINKDKEVSTKEKDGYTRGCNCRLDSKTRVPHAKCIIGQW